MLGSAVSAPARPAAAEPTDAALTVPSNGFSWTMKERFGELHDGIVDYHWNQAAPEPLRWGAEADREKYDPAFVDPGAFEVNFDACPTQIERDASSLQPPQAANTYRWTIGGQPLPSVRSCLLTHDFAKQGPYHVRLTITGPDAGGPFDQQVVVRDHLIVSIGDSYASGEGNPDVNQTGTPTKGTKARWVDRRCHRSAHAGPAQAALALERADPHSSVTFLSFACSGANINRVYNAYSDACPGDNPPNDTYKSDIWDPYKPGDPNRPAGSGVLGSYRGPEVATCTDFSDHVPPQLQQMAAAVGDRRIDAVVMSAGGNDIGFGPLAATCLVPFKDCRLQEVTGTDGTKVILPVRFEQDREAMNGADGKSGRYKALQDGLANLRQATGAPVRIAKVYITEYPDPTTDLLPDDPKARVPYCDKVADDINWAVAIEGDEVVWARDTVLLGGLNRAVANAAGNHGWQYVDGMANAFLGHGYCVGDTDKPHAERWIRTATESVLMQGPEDKTKTTGTLHPTARGHQVYAERIVHYVMPALDALPVDDRTPPQAPTISVPDPINAANQTTVALTGSAEAQTTAQITLTDTTGTPPISGAVLVGWDGYSATFDVSPFADGPVYAAVTLSDAAGNTSPTATVTVTKDTRGPSTGAGVSPAPVNGWNNNDVTVTLTAQDLSGVRDVTYSASGATTIPPTTVGGSVASLTLSAEGDTIISYFATDKSGNTEPANTIT
ncbi:MAG: hypothetical protein LC799_20075, partial [Actinobacteria bacterium]|nr:hypothetical protein [Actinomycetota bacterium]